MTTGSKNGNRLFESTEASSTAVSEVPPIRPFEHWAFEVDTPFRPVSELLEQPAMTSTQLAEAAEGLDSASEDFGDGEVSASTSEAPAELTGFGFEAETAEFLDEALDEGLTPAAPAEFGEFEAPVAAQPTVPPIAGQTPSSRPFTGPKVQLEHWHKKTTCDAATGVCTAATTYSQMSPAAMNPGFIDTTTGAVIVGSGASSLQARLAKLITTKHGSLVTGAARKAGQGTAGDRIRIALVDLSGKKLANPEFAGWGSTMAMQGVSTTKVVVLYALHQLLLDVHREAVSSKHTSKATLVAAMNKIWQNAGLTVMPDISDLIEFTERPPKTVDPNLSASTLSDVKAAFWGNSNAAVSRLMLKVTFPYIASVLWQSGLHHASRGGLWLSVTFGRDPGVAKMASKADHVLVTSPGRKGEKVAWRHDPRRGSSTNRQNVTALSLATMFTLLAQERLGSQLRSQAIGGTLRTTCRFFWTTKSKAALGVTTEPPAKCGVDTFGGATHQNDVTLVEHGSKRYVAVVLTRNVDGTIFEKIIADLDGLI